ncbi:MAG: RdgB/HAM1 family non-canonical purine NTP pyrophosphatase [Bacilli bacterium]|jgi:XTP/dITP diphosphohydrolase
MKIVIATNNMHKLKEYRSLFSETTLEVLSINDININAEIDETGESYEENSTIKADNIAKLTNLLVIADDSGIEIETLGSSPGINSSRFASHYQNQTEANQAILESLSNVANRNAKFVCVIALANYQKETQLFRGECPGKILFQAEGKGGFGYDPIFYSHEAEQCFAKLSTKQKNRFSHRGKAVKKLIEFLKTENII